MTKKPTPVAGPPSSVGIVPVVGKLREESKVETVVKTDVKGVLSHIPDTADKGMVVDGKAAGIREGGSKETAHK